MGGGGYSRSGGIWGWLWFSGGLADCGCGGGLGGCFGAFLLVLAGF